MKVGERGEARRKKAPLGAALAGLVYGGDKGSLTSGLGNPTASAPIQPSMKKRVPGRQASQEEGCGEDGGARAHQHIQRNTSLRWLVIAICGCCAFLGEPARRTGQRSSC